MSAACESPKRASLRKRAFTGSRCDSGHKNGPKVAGQAGLAGLTGLSGLTGLVILASLVSLATLTSLANKFNFHMSRRIF